MIRNCSSFLVLVLIFSSIGFFILKNPDSVLAEYHNFKDPAVSTSDFQSLTSNLSIFTKHSMSGIALGVEDAAQEVFFKIKEIRNQVMESSPLDAGIDAGKYLGWRISQIESKVKRIAKETQDVLIEFSDQAKLGFENLAKRLTKLPEPEEEEIRPEEARFSPDSSQDLSPEIPSENAEAERLRKEELGRLRSQSSELPIIQATPIKIEQTVVERVIGQTIAKVLIGLQTEPSQAISQVNAKLLSEVEKLKSLIQQKSQENFQAIALTNKINSLSGVTLSNVTVSNISNLDDDDIPNDITISTTKAFSGTSASLSSLTVSAMTSGSLFFAGTGGLLSQDNSNLYWDDANNRLGLGTTTPGSLLSLGSLANFTTATSTFYSSGGLDLTSGCFAINGACVGGGGGGAGTAGQFPYYAADGTTLTATSSLFITTAGNIGIGTTSPYAKLSVVGQTVSAYFTATTSIASLFPYASTTALTVSGTASTTNLIVSGTASSTFSGPLESYSGNFIIGSQGTSNNLLFNPYGGNIGIGTTSPFAILAVENIGTGFSFQVSDQTSDATPFTLNTLNYETIFLGIYPPKAK